MTFLECENLFWAHCSSNETGCRRHITRAEMLAERPLGKQRSAPWGYPKEIWMVICGTGFNALSLFQSSRILS